MTPLITGTLAVTFLWETLRTLSPWGLPVWLSPLIVFGVSLALGWPDWRFALAVAGAVGVLHSLLRDRVDSPRSSAMVRLGVGSRVPPLP